MVIAVAVIQAEDERDGEFLESPGFDSQWANDGDKYPKAQGGGNIAVTLFFLLSKPVS
jgi:hypothetical protein